MQNKPAVGFGFGDCVIVELLKDKKLLPKFEREVDDCVVAYSEDLRPIVCKVAQKYAQLFFVVFFSRTSRTPF